MQRNVELLQRTMQHIIDHPEQHNQGYFVNEYGTAGCFVGWAAMLSGSWGKFNNSNMWDAGAELLGLTRSEAANLFCSQNTRPALELMVKDLVNGDRLRDWTYYRHQES